MALVDTSSNMINENEILNNSTDFWHHNFELEEQFFKKYVEIKRKYWVLGI